MDRQKLDAILARKLPVFTASGLNCAETVLSTMCAYWDVESPLIPRIATPFGGGLAATRGVCGAVSGALMAILACAWGARKAATVKPPTQPRAVIWSGSKQITARAIVPI